MPGQTVTRIRGPSVLRFRRWPIALSIAALGVTVAGGHAAIPAGTPSQASNDGTAADAGFSGAAGLWGDLPGGVAGRPFIRSLSVVNGGVSTPVITDGIAAAPAVQNGDVTAVVAPLNLCRTGQTPSPGRCYATPNRVAVAFGYANNGNVGTDFANPETPLRQAVTPDTVFDVTIALNTLGSTLRWTWINGDLERWTTSRLGRDDAEIRVRVRPVVTPAIDWSTVPANGCTATPIRDCDIPQSQGETLSANLVLSLDDSLDPALTGSVFATEGAIAGFLEPTGTASAPVLDLQIASAHLTAAGAPQTGAITALIPSQALLNLYGVLSADASSFFRATRTGAAGSQSAPVFRRATVGADGTDGLHVSISGITFSAPTYALSRAATAPRTSARRRGALTTVTSPAVRACRAAACTATVMRLPSGLKGRAATAGTGRTTASGAVVLSLPSKRLAKGSRYTLVLRHAAGPKRGKLVTTAVGTTS